MIAYERGLMVAVAMLAGLLAGRAEAVTPAQKCQATKLKVTGKYAFCRLKADAKAVKTGQPADYTKCVATFQTKFADAETEAGGQCPTQGDIGGVEDQVIADASSFKLLQARWVDNGDGTVSDTETGLMWEQKDNLNGGANLSNPHDADNTYSWATAGTTPNGTAYTDFLGTLNNGTTTDGTTISGCFAGHCDWRLPTSMELLGIVDLTATGCGAGDPCIDMAFGPTVASTYWSSTTYSDLPVLACFVGFNDGTPNCNGKPLNFYVRAVRGGS